MRNGDEGPEGVVLGQQEPSFLGFSEQIQTSAQAAERAFSRQALKQRENHYAGEDSEYNGPFPLSCLVGASGPVAGCFSAFGEQIGWGLVRLDAPWRQARGCSAVDVVEDLADEVGIGHICNHAQLPASERAECDVNFEHSFQSLRPGQRCGGCIGCASTRQAALQRLRTTNRTNPVTPARLEGESLDGDRPRSTPAVADA